MDKHEIDSEMRRHSAEADTAAARQRRQRQDVASDTRRGSTMSRNAKRAGKVAGTAAGFAVAAATLNSGDAQMEHAVYAGAPDVTPDQVEKKLTHAADTIEVPAEVTPLAEGGDVVLPHPTEADQVVRLSMPEVADQPVEPDYTEPTPDSGGIQSGEVSPEESGGVSAP